MRTVILLPFSEPDGVAPSDRQGTLDDLAITTGLARPDRVTDPSWTNGGHTYVQADLDGWLAADTADGVSVLQRDVTIQVLLAFDLTNATGPACVICRGIDGSADEYYPWGLELAEQAGNPGFVEIRWLWMDSAGTLADVLPGVYQHPGDTAEILLTATRRWVATDAVVCRYYVNDVLLAEVETDAGDIGGGTTGHTSVGARKEAGTWGNGFSGVIDQVKVTDYEMSGEEVAALWQRMTVHQPNGVVTLRALAPPGAPWSRDPSSDIGKLITVAGQGLGLAAARAEELRQNALPHRAYADTIAPWERLVGLPQNERTALDTRRARVVAQLSRDNGYAPPLVQQALSGPFDLDPADVELLEFGPTVTDGFATLEEERWHLEPAAGAWSIVAGELQLFRAGGSNLLFSAAAGWNPCHARLPIEDATGMAIGAKMTFWGGLPPFTMAGLSLYERVSQDALFFGVRFSGGAHKIGWQAVVAGVAVAWTNLDDATNAPWWFRILRDAAAGAGRYKLQYSATGFDAMTSVDVNVGIANPNNAGLGAVSSVTPTGADLTVTFDDFFARVPLSQRGFHWYAYRDPGLPGAVDLLGANTTVRTLKPAHTHAYAVTSRSLLCDSDASVCDGGPMGGL
jgi:hypothetical protein